MNELLDSIAPKSDQLNADDLIGRNLTVKITDVVIKGGEQPVWVYYDGCNNKPYKPSKGMRRGMIVCWGAQNKGQDWKGKTMTLTRNEDVLWQGKPTGGIQISHASDIDKPVTFMLTVSRSKRIPFTINPLVTQQKVESKEVITMRESLESSANLGTDSLKAAWEKLSKEDRNAVGGAAYLNTLKQIAQKTDEQQLANDDDGI